MHTVGAFEAKAKIAELLDKVAAARDCAYYQAR